MARSFGKENQYNSFQKEYFQCLVLSQAKKVTSHVFVIEVSILPLTTILIIDFGIVPTAWYFMFFILLPQQNRQHFCKIDFLCNS
jgi:hypothetical protein